MNMSRRGFLWSMMAAGVGAGVTFDPLTGLWVPEAKTVVAATSMEQVEGLTSLRRAALIFAKELGSVLKSESLGTLAAAEWAGTAKDGRGGRLFVPELGGKGYFEPHGKRITVTRHLSTLRPSFEMDRYGHLITERVAAEAVAVTAARQIAQDVRRAGLSLLAPITSELRPGTPFTGNITVATAIDEETGVSARALQYEQPGDGPMVCFEVAGGKWYTPSQLADKWRDGYGGRTRVRKRLAKAKVEAFFAGVAAPSGLIEMPTTVTWDDDATRIEQAGAFPEA